MCYRNKRYGKTNFTNVISSKFKQTLTLRCPVSSYKESGKIQNGFRKWKLKICWNDPNGHIFPHGFFSITLHKNGLAWAWDDSGQTQSWDFFFCRWNNIFCFLFLHLAKYIIHLHPLIMVFIFAGEEDSFSGNSKRTNEKSKQTIFIHVSSVCEDWKCFSPWRLNIRCCFQHKWKTRLSSVREPHFNCVFNEEFTKRRMTIAKEIINEKAGTIVLIDKQRIKSKYWLNGFLWHIVTDGAPTLNVWNGCSKSTRSIRKKLAYYSKHEVDTKV